MTRLEGKKVRVIQVRGPLRVESVELRLDDEGRFLAYLAGQKITADTQADLVAELRKKLEKTQRLAFARVIVVEFSIQSKDGYHSWTRSCGSEDDDEGAMVRGFSFDYEVYDVSDQKFGDKGERRVVQRFAEDEAGELTPEGRGHRGAGHEEIHWRDNDRTALPYTPERHARLRELRAAVGALALKLREVLDDPAKLGPALDGNARLLPPVGGES